MQVGDMEPDLNPREIKVNDMYGDFTMSNKSWKELADSIYKELDIKER